MEYEFDSNVRQMKALTTQLIKHSFPAVSPAEEEILSWMKQREFTLDGYELILYFNKCKYSDVLLETLQVFGKYFSFLPFNLVCKVAKKFLGDQEVSLIDVVHNKKSESEAIIDQYSRSIYVWTVYYDAAGKPILNPLAKKVEHREYDGFRYSVIDRSQVKFFY